MQGGWSLRVPLLEHLKALEEFLDALDALIRSIDDNGAL
jgi:hypothetical protein